jgi:adenylate cyclase
VSENRTYSFGEYTLDLARGALLRSGADVKLRPKSFEVLRLLVERHGRLVTKEELLDAVWGRTVVTEGSIVQCLIDVRRAIGDESQQMVKTVPRRGYIFDLPVTLSDGTAQEARVAVTLIAPQESGSDERPSPTAPQVQSRLRSLRQGLFAAALISLVPFAIWWGLESRGTDATPPVEHGAAQAPHNSIAVLPFVNMSSDPDSEYFCDGISEEILNRLAAFPDLHVIARTSSFALKDSDLDARKLSGLLGVRYLLQGSVRRDGDRVRITAQLVDDSGVQVWSDAYDRERHGIFAIQQDIAEAVATNVVPKIVARSPAEPEALPNLEAYQHYLVGRQIFDKRMPRYAELAEEQFEKAVAIDSHYAEALAELAILWTFHTGTAQKAEEAIDLALALKPGLARAHVAKGLMLLEARRPPDLPGAEAAFRQALTLDPNMVDASTWLASLLAEQGRHAERLSIMERAARIDPLAPALMTNLAGAYAERGDPARAEQGYLRLLELPQPSYYVYWSLFDHYFCVGRMVESNEMAKRLVRGYDESGPLGAYVYLARSYSRLGLWRSAEIWLERFERERPDGPDPINLDRIELLRMQGRFKEMEETLRAMRDSIGAKLPAAMKTREYGILQALVGDHRGAVQTLAPQTDIDQPVSDESDANARHALAWAYLNTGATDRAHRILSEVERGFRERQTQGWLHLSVDLAMFAQNAVLASDEDLAIDRLRQAVDAGWRDYYSVSNDPRWESLRDDVRYKELMASVKADIDAQRARLEQIETTDEPVARLDAGLENGLFEERKIN